jgi:hypothetical protein
MIWSHVRSGALAAVAFTVILPVAAAAAPFNYTFDSDTQGWVAVAAGPGQTTVYSPTGGNPGGFVGAQHFINAGIGTGTITGMLGVGRAITFDAADYGGTLSFDSKVVSADPAIHGATLAQLTLSGITANGMLFDFILALSGPVTSAFGTSSFTLGTAANWSYNRMMDPLSPRTATEADFLAYLPLVTEIRMYTSFKLDRGTSGAISVGFDNISLTAPAPEPTPVPEPATLTLLGAGLATIVARRSRRQRPVAS